MEITGGAASAATAPHKKIYHHLYSQVPCAMVGAKWEGALDTDRMHRHLNNETDAEADSPESVLVEEEETAGIGTGRGTAGAPSPVRA
jgi:hypothetical protein